MSKNRQSVRVYVARCIDLPRLDSSPIPVGIRPAMSLKRSSSLASVTRKVCETNDDVAPRQIHGDFLTKIAEFGNSGWYCAVEKIRFQI